MKLEFYSKICFLVQHENEIWKLNINFIFRFGKKNGWPLGTRIVCLVPVGFLAGC